MSPVLPFPSSAGLCGQMTTAMQFAANSRQEIKKLKRDTKSSFRMRNGGKNSMAKHQYYDAIR
jgi:hypothetical protein